MCTFCTTVIWNCTTRPPSLLPRMCVCAQETETETETERHTHRERERDGQRETARRTNRRRETHTHRKIDRERDRKRERDRQTERDRERERERALRIQWDHAALTTRSIRNECRSIACHWPTNFFFRKLTGLRQLLSLMDTQ